MNESQARRRKFAKGADAVGSQTGEPAPFPSGSKNSPPHWLNNEIHFWRKDGLTVLNLRNEQEELKLTIGVTAFENSKPSRLDAGEKVKEQVQAKEEAPSREQKAMDMLTRTFNVTTDTKNEVQGHDLKGAIPAPLKLFSDPLWSVEKEEPSKPQWEGKACGDQESAERVSESVAPFKQGPSSNVAIECSGWRVSAASPMGPVTCHPGNPPARLIRGVQVIPTFDPAPHPQNLYDDTLVSAMGYAAMTVPSQRGFTSSIVPTIGVRGFRSMEPRTVNPNATPFAPSARKAPGSSKPFNAEAAPFVPSSPMETSTIL